MKIGIGIDTGGTCTDSVIYDFENRKILASAKTPTTKENLAIGIGQALDLLPGEMLQQTEMIALSTTLATNACVENKGGRGKLIFLGIEEKTVREVGAKYGIPMDDDMLLFIPCKETYQGEILEEPDWQQVKELLIAELADCQAVGIVELFAAGTGAALEKKTREIVQEIGLPVVCGYELFEEKNVMGRGAGALLNARLIFVVADFLQAVKEAMKQRGLAVPVVIVRSDGSLMNEEFSKKRPIETLLCGPVASVMGAAELYRVENGVVVDMGGTTTDISIVRNGRPVRAQGGITVGNWRIYVKGMYVDTFGLGGDSEVIMSQDGKLTLGSRRIMPVCMAAARYPGLRELLEAEEREEVKVNTWRRHIYVGLKDIQDSDAYSSQEKRIAAGFYQNPMNFVELERRYGLSVVPHNLERLVQEGVLIRCGVTPTDAMHVLGDYNGYDTEASRMACAVMGVFYDQTAEGLAESIYELVSRKLYCNIVRILLMDQEPEYRKTGIGAAMEKMIERLYEEAAMGQGQVGKSAQMGAGEEEPEFLRLSLNCDVPLIGVGGPIGVFLERVADLLHTKALIGAYSSVANALGAIVCNIEVTVAMEIVPDSEGEAFRIFGNGETYHAQTLEEAEALATEAARHLARAEALRRGAAEEKLYDRVTYEKKEAPLGYGGSIFLSERVNAIVGSR